VASDVTIPSRSGSLVHGWTARGEAGAGADAEAAAAFVRDTLPGERIGIIGTSLGGTAALLGTKPLRIGALVPESGYPYIRSAIVNSVAVRLGTAAGRVIASLYLGLMPPILHLHERSASPDRSHRGFDITLLLMAGTADQYTTIEESRALRASGGTEAVLAGRGSRSCRSGCLRFRG